MKGLMLSLLFCSIVSVVSAQDTRTYWVWGSSLTTAQKNLAKHYGERGNKKDVLNTRLIPVVKSPTNYWLEVTVERSSEASALSALESSGKILLVQKFINGKWVGVANPPSEFYGITISSDAKKGEK